MQDASNQSHLLINELAQTAFAEQADFSARRSIQTAEPINTNSSEVERQARQTQSILPRTAAEGERKNIEKRGLKGLLQARSKYQMPLNELQKSH